MLPMHWTGRGARTVLAGAATEGGPPGFSRIHTDRDGLMATNDTLDFSELAGGDEVSVDEKGRLVLGRELREKLGTPFVIGRGEAGSLALYPKAYWDDLLNLVRSVDRFDPDRQDFERLLIGGASVNEGFDKSGRILIPKDMRTFAKIENRARVVGMTERVEIWAPKEFESFQNNPREYNKARRDSIAQAYRAMTGKA